MTLNFRWPVLHFQRSAILVTLAVLLSSLTACGNPQAAKNLEEALAADPRLKDNPVTFGTNQTPGSQNSQTTVELPAKQATPTPNSERTSEVLPQPEESPSIEPVPSETSAAQPSGTTGYNNSATARASTEFSDLNKTPPELRQYIQDLAALGVLSTQSNAAQSDSFTANQFEPNKTITRREYARWLIAANNAIYSTNPSKQIRLASESSSPAFQDVPKTDPDFPAIQGLAEAGLIPSPLSGDSTMVLFRPDAPLTREQLILWKVPLDTRQALPAANIETVKQTWGFQDVGKIDSKALRAVLADFQIGEQSNIRRVFGYTTLFQPQKPVTRAEAATALWYFGTQGEGISAQEVLKVKLSLR
jgi:hypothetical protein